MADLIMAHSWQSLKWVHLFEKEKLRIIQNFLIDRKKHYTLEGRLGKRTNRTVKTRIMINEEYLRADGFNKAIIGIDMVKPKSYLR
jgi:hypothetical protein